MHATRTILVVATALSAVLFLGMTVDTLRQMPSRTNSDQLTPEVVEGKRVWQQYDCNDCHTILGIGGYYAPDVTKSYAIRGGPWIHEFLKDPAKMYPTGRQMPNFRLNDDQINSVVAFLKWTSEINTNDWPPAPEGIAGEQQPPGAQVFLAQHCNTCHKIEGSGGDLAPDLTHVGSRRTRDWILDQINNPRAHKADSIMPSFAQLSETDKQSLADYLANLR